MLEYSFFVALAASATHLPPMPPPPPGWNSHRVSYNAKRNGVRDISAYGDFDGDKSPDIVSIFRDQNRFGVMVKLGTSKNWALLTAGPVTEIDTVGVETIEPGTFTVRCDKRLTKGSCHSFVSKQQSIGVYSPEASMSIFHWQDGRFLEKIITD